VADLLRGAAGEQDVGAHSGVGRLGRGEQVLAV
jgi:hypothetical protein